MLHVLTPRSLSLDCLALQPEQMHQCRLLGECLLPDWPQRR